MGGAEASKVTHPRPQPFAVVDDIVKRHRTELQRRFPHAVGMGVGVPAERKTPAAPEDACFVILINLERGPAPKADSSFEGVPIRFIVTGRFRAL